MSYDDSKLKVDSSGEKINDKVHNEIKDTNIKIYWYIKFSLPLNEGSVSQKTMTVTRINGDIFITDIIYNKTLELIVIDALEAYKEDEYYILHISKKLCSEDFITLKNDVHILFKIKGGQVSEYKQLALNIIVPKPKMPKDTKARVYLFQKSGKNPLDYVDKDKLPFVMIKLNPLIALIGIPVFIFGVYSNNITTFGIGIMIALIGFFHIIAQMRSNEFRSNFHYNMGVIRFNRGKYNKANKIFKKALNMNLKNEFAEYAVSKVSFFIDA